MNKSANAIIVLYNEEPLVNNAIVPVNIAQILCSSGLVDDKEDITIVTKDSDSISKALLQGTIEVPTSRVVGIGKSAEETVKDATIEAIKMIGTMFAESLITGKATSNYGPFMRDLLMHRDDTVIRSAIKVVAESHASVPKKLFRDYNITPGAIETIRDANGTLL